MSSLLATKLHRPSVPAKRVQRPQLIQRLNEGLESGRNLTLVSAPAGFGKTTCIGEWLNGLHRPVTWLSLDEADNDPARFFAYLITAVQKVDANLGREIEGVLRSGQLPPSDVISTTLINDILEVEGRFLLVLDDFHVIQDGLILQVLEKLVVNLFEANWPQPLHLVLLTREDPALPLARLRANNQMTEIRAGDLRFTGEEANRFLKEVMGLALSQADITVLEERTEGWIVGLQLAGLSIRDRASPSSFIAALSGSHRHILSYLTEQVLSRQPEEIQQFLLQTSILDRLSGDLCNAVIERTDGHSPLGRLFNANLFLVSLDDEGQWFRYHHLFADLLQARLRQAYPADTIATLHTRAAGWYEQNGFVVEAVNHALAARDFDNAAHLIEENAYPMMTRGELTTLLRWIEALPDKVIQRHPVCTLAKAWVLIFAGAIQQVEPLLHKAEAQIAAEDETLIARQVHGNAAAMRAFIAIMAGDNERALKLAERAEALLPESSFSDGSAVTGGAVTGGASPFDFAARTIMPFTTGTAYRGQGQYEKAAEAFEREVQMGEEAGDSFVWVNALVEVVNTRRVQGKLVQANETCRRALSRMVERGISPFGSSAKLEAALSEVLREQNELDEAYQRVTEAIAHMPAWNMPVDQLFAHLVLMHIQAAQGDFASAFETLRAAQNLQATYPAATSVVNRTVALDEIRLYLTSGDVATAARLMEGIHAGASRLVFLREQELNMLARVCLAQSKPDEAVQVLDPLVKDAGAAERLSIWLETLALQACALDAQGHREAAVTVLIKALTLAEQEGFVRIFVDEGEAMRSLLSAAARRLALAGDPASIPLKAYIAKLLNVFSGSPSPSAAPRAQSEAAGLVEPLTTRELQVMQLIAAGDSNQAIAGKLVITVSAVKKHTGNIFGKLNVNSRTQAVARARQLGLLPADA